MTLLEHALQHLDNKIAEEEARLEDARRMVGFLQQERAQLLAEAARAIDAAIEQQERTATPRQWDSTTIR